MFPGLSLALLLALLCGCEGFGGETLGYYGQAVRGQAQLLLARQPIDDLIADPATPDALRDRLRLAADMLAFADGTLGLPVDGRYGAYVALDRDAVVYNVFAAPPLTLTPVTWCFPVAGCVSYRGYFELDDARAKAARLAADGLDVHVGGAAAYSTLGWFDDPLLSTFIHRDEAALAELLFHELAHGVVYVPGETAFNESFATFVGREGAQRWLLSRDQGAAMLAWQARNARRAAFVAAALAVRQTLAEGYGAIRADTDDVDERLRRRQALWTQMQSDWLARRDPDLAGYDAFFTDPPSNARLNTVADYNIHLPAFARLYDEVGGDLRQFLDRVRALGQDPEARALFLNEISDR